MPSARSVARSYWEATSTSGAHYSNPIFSYDIHHHGLNFYGQKQKHHSNSFLIFLYYFLMCFRKPEANWGSSADAQTFITAMKSTQDLTDSPDHIKTYRPKILVLTGSPAHRYRSLTIRQRTFCHYFSLNKKTGS